MRSPKVCFLAACLLTAPSAFPQFMVTLSGPGTSPSVTVTPPRANTFRAMTGSPYSGTEVRESVQTLADGTHLKRPGMETKTWRDSQGRTRTERPVFIGPVKPVDFKPVDIQDPVAGFEYLLDPLNLVAHRVPMTSTSFPAPTASVPPPIRREPITGPDGTVSEVEALGSKIISGVEAFGTRRTTTFPTGSSFGNDRPVKSVNEMWVAMRLGLVVQSVMAAPTGGESTSSWRDLSLAEPNPELFRIPVGYKVVDETGSFTISVPMK